MTRQLDVATLDQAAIDYAGMFLQPDRKSPSGKVFVTGPSRVKQDFYNATFKDEFEYLDGKIRDELGKRAKARYDALAKDSFKPRDDKVFERLLKEHLAIDKNGSHIEGAIGKVVVGGRVVGKRVTRHGVLLAEWPVYAGEEEERSIKSSVVDPIPPAGVIWPDETSHMGAPSVLQALNTNVSIAFAQAGINAALDLLDEGSSNGILRGYTTAQPVDPNVAVSGQTLLFTLALTDPAFGNATDDSPGALATAASITDDTSADATATLAWLRGFSSNDGASPLNAHIDGEAGTSSADFIFNTLAIVSGATVSMTSWTVTQPQGPTAT